METRINYLTAFLPQDTSELEPTEDPLYDMEFPFTQARDSEGSDPLPHVRIPGKLRAVMSEIISQRRTRLTEWSLYVRAALGHYTDHLLERLNDPKLNDTWEELKAQNRIQMQAREITGAESFATDVGDAIYALIEEFDLVGVRELLEATLSGVLRLSESSVKRMRVKKMMKNRAIERACSDLERDSEIVRRILALYKGYRKR